MRSAMSLICVLMRCVMITAPPERLKRRVSSSSTLSNGFSPSKRTSVSAVKNRPKSASD